MRVIETFIVVGFIVCSIASCNEKVSTSYYCGKEFKKAYLEFNKGFSLNTAKEREE